MAENELIVQLGRLSLVQSDFKVRPGGVERSDASKLVLMVSNDCRDVFYDVDGERIVPKMQDDCVICLAPDIKTVEGNSSIHPEALFEHRRDELKWPRDHFKPQDDPEPVGRVDTVLILCAGEYEWHWDKTGSADNYHFHLKQPLKAFKLVKGAGPKPIGTGAVVKRVVVGDSRIQSQSGGALPFPPG